MFLISFPCWCSLWLIENMKIAFMGTPALAVPCLDALAKNHEIAVVVSQPDKIGGRGHKLIAPPVKQRALDLGVPILQPRRARDEAFIEELRAFAPDAIAVVAFGQILPQSILDMAPRGCVNLHYSLLPRWRGAAPVQYAIWNGDQITGVTTQWMAAKLDAGDIIQQVEVPIKDGETADELFPRLNEIGARVLVETFVMLENGTAPRAPQDESKITLAPQIEKDDAKINWTMSAATIVNTARAWSAWPVAFCDFQDAPLKIIRAQIVDKTGEAGTILELDVAGPIIAAADKSVQLLEVQAPGKPRMNAADWARGARLEVGRSFN